MIYRIDLETQQVMPEECPPAWAGLGGRALTSAIVAAEVPPRAWPLGPQNRLVIAPGLLGASGASSTGRLSIGARSPLTGTIKESNTGGRPGQQLARLGITALVFGRPAEPRAWYVAVVRAGGIELHPAGGLLGREIYATVEQLLQEYGQKVGVLAIGPAGEQRLSAANIGVTDVDGIPARHAGRGGLGAVMGAMGLKAIVVDPAGAALPPPADPAGLRQARRRFAEALQAHPSTGKSLPDYGTSALIAAINTVGGLPTRNFSRGDFPQVDAVSGQALRDRIVQRQGQPTHPCMAGCVIRCSNVLPGPEGGELTRALEYESIALLGPNCGIGDLDAIARLNRRCDELGLDTMEMGSALAVAMEAGLVPFGDGAAALALLDQVPHTDLGRILGHGAAVTGRILGVRRVPAVKGQALAAYDPRALKGTALTYCTSSQGADHTAGNCLPGSALPDGTRPDPHTRERQAELSSFMQLLATAFDSLGLCWFTRAPLLADPALLTSLLAAQRGGEWTLDGLLDQAGRTLRMELEYNRAAGFTPADDALPDFFAQEALPPLDLALDLDGRDAAATLARIAAR